MVPIDIINDAYSIRNHRRVFLASNIDARLFILFISSNLERMQKWNKKVVYARWR
jgi:hypothetical protein